MKKRLLSLALCLGLMVVPVQAAYTSGEYFDYPTEEECMARSAEAGAADFSLDERSPYLSAWLSIDKETRYDEYCVDIRADDLPAGTYCSGANWFLDLSGLREQYKTVEQEGISGYAGLQRWEENAGYGAIMSLWDIECTDYAGKKTTISAIQTYPEGKDTNHFDHEGNGVNSITPYEWKAGHPYRMLLKCGTSEETGNTTIEQWIMDLDLGKWTHICTFDTGVRDTCFIGSCAFFLENYLQNHAGEVRSMDVSNIRIHTISDGEWHDVTSVSGFNKQFGTGRWLAGANEDSFYMITSGVPGREGSNADKPLSITNYESGKPYQELTERFMSDWAVEVISDAKAAGLIPEWMMETDLTKSITRGDFAAAAVGLYRAMGGNTEGVSKENPFSDVDDSLNSYEDILLAKALSIANGKGGGRFDPTGTLTREEAAVMLCNVYKALGKTIPTVSATAFADDDGVSAWAKSAVAFMNSNGVVSGKGENKYDPQGLNAAEEALTMALNMLNKLK